MRNYISVIQLFFLGVAWLCLPQNSWKKSKWWRTKQICQKITVEEDISMLFSKTRLFIRVKHLNEKLNVEDTKLRRKFRSHLNKFANWIMFFNNWSESKISNSVFSWFTVLLVALEQNSHVKISSELSILTLSRHYPMKIPY